MPELEERLGSEETGETTSIGSVVMSRRIIKEQTSQDLSSAPLAYTTLAMNKRKLLSATIHFSAPISQTVKFSIVDANSNYTVIISESSVAGIDDIVIVPAGGEEYILDGSDQFKIECTNTGTPASIAYVTIRMEYLGV